MRAAVEQAFGPLEEVEGDNRRKRWRLRSDGPRGLVSVSTEELGALSTAAGALEGAGLSEHAARLEDGGGKAPRRRRAGAREQLEEELEALLQAEGLAMRPGPRQPVDPDVLRVVRDAIHRRRKVEFDYLSRSTGRLSHQIAEPCGLLYGNRPFLVARTDWSGEPRLWRLANVSGARSGWTTSSATRISTSGASLGAPSAPSRRTPVKVQLRFDARAAPDAATFLFHPDQKVKENDDKR